MSADLVFGQGLALLLTLALHVSLLLALVWALNSWWLARPALRDRAWKIALCGGLLTAGAQISLGWVPLAGEWELATPEAVAAAPLEETAYELPALSVEPVELAAGSVPARELAQRTAPAQPLPWMRIALGLWLLGALLSLIPWLARYRSLRDRLDERRTLAYGPWIDQLDRWSLSAGWTRPVRLSHTPKLCTPITFGILRAEICVPTRALEELGADEFRAMLAHELGHVVRRDPTWLALWGIVERLLFFQPLIHKARQRWQDEVELLCDDFAVRCTRARLPLASCLTEVASWIVNDRSALPVAPMAAGGARLSERVQRLVKNQGPVDTRTPWFIPLAVLVLTSIAVATPRVTAVLPQSATPPAAREGSAHSEAKRVIGPLARTPLATVSDTSPEETLAGLDREIGLLQREVSALEEELARSGLVEVWSQRLMSTKQRLERLQVARGQLATLVRSLLEPETHNENTTKNPQGEAR